MELLPIALFDLVHACVERIELRTRSVELSLECVVTGFDQAVVADDAIDRAIELRGNATAAAKQFLHRRAVGVERSGKLVVVDGPRPLRRGRDAGLRALLESAGAADVPATHVTPPRLRPPPHRTAPQYSFGLDDWS